MGDISLKFLFMTKSVAGFFCIVKVFFLLCLLFSASVQADTSWATQASRYLEQLLKNNPQHLPELNEQAVLHAAKAFQPQSLIKIHRLKNSVSESLYLCFNRHSILANRTKFIKSSVANYLSESQ